MLKTHSKRDLQWLVETSALVASSVVSDAFTVEYNGTDAQYAGHILALSPLETSWDSAALAEAALQTALDNRRHRPGKYNALAKDALLESFLIVVDYS